MSTWRYMLDTNIVSHMIRVPEGAVVSRVRDVGSDTLCVSALVASELRYGAVKRGSERLSSLVESTLERLDIIAYEAAAAVHYAEIRDQLSRSGNLIGPMDMLIAAHARALELVLVTDNTREFSRVEGLTIENWLAAEEHP
ncbi:type II toxin-antitoxin system VapC family toxin [Rhizobium sp. Root483D2]|uniref:type II toxin-antitoxin system VapC family toxin n=1 Tax=Rhizobium sp. Root483D2 TaxID=1736545 RepID=UPI000A9D7C61|nr:type II toxin-antitoxin system VapC family toxin [Rhizobium sp. Root483D2]